MAKVKSKMRGGCMLIILPLILLFTLLITGCDETFDKRKLHIVHTIENRDDIFCSYQTQRYEGTGIRKVMEVIDSCGKYSIGDTIK